MNDNTISNIPKAEASSEQVTNLRLDELFRKFKEDESKLTTYLTTLSQLIGFFIVDKNNTKVSAACVSKAKEISNLSAVILENVIQIAQENISENSSGFSAEKDADASTLVQNSSGPSRTSSAEVRLKFVLNTIVYQSFDSEANKC